MWTPLFGRKSEDGGGALLRYSLSIIFLVTLKMIICGGGKQTLAAAPDLEVIEKSQNLNVKKDWGVSQTVHFAFFFIFITQE